MSDTAQIPSYPRNLSYSCAKLAGSIIKQRVKINSDLSSYKQRDIITFYLPVGRMINLNSIVIYAKGSCTSATNAAYKFPRGGLHSLIDQLQVSVNGKIISSIANYNYIFNTLGDIEGYSSHDQYSKRCTELIDPSLKLSSSSAYVGTANSATAGDNYEVVNNTTNTTNDTDIRFCANNFLGFFSGSSSTINLNDLGQMKISITLADTSVLWQDGDATLPTGPGFSLSEVYMTLETMTYTNSLYADLVKEQLQGSGLNIAFYEYVSYQLNSFTRHNGTTNNSIQINTNSLDQCIMTFRPSDYSTIKALQLHTAGASSSTYNQVLANLTTTSGGVGGLFNNSYFFVRDAAGLTAGSWYVNSQPFTQQANALEIFNNALQAENYRNLDLNSGLHPGCYNINRFMRQYFTDYLSLENLSTDNGWYISGLNGNSSTIQVQYNATFGSTSTDTSLSTSLIPFIICRCSRVLNVKAGRQLDLSE